ncbi:hypothetical protein FGB62_275g07 [Gracilaria domingensis]|nr:hypothetical protein FGB62_275g07 [Gracilaria domingensis]
MQKKNRSGYMSGADKLLKAKVVAAFCHFEGFANTRFNLSTLNTVRNWPLQKIRNTVSQWMKQLDDDPWMILKFVNEKKEVNRKTQREKSCAQHSRSAAKQSIPSPRGEPRQATTVVVSALSGLESYIDWTVPGDLALLDKLQQNLENEDAEVRRNEGSSVIVIEDNQDKIHVVERVGKTITAMIQEGVTEFNFASLIANQVSKSASDIQQSGTLNFIGGTEQDELKITRNDVKTINRLSWARDQAVLFASTFLSNWTLPAMRDVFVLDPMFATHWWDSVLNVNSNDLPLRQREVKSNTRSKVNSHELV